MRRAVVILCLVAGFANSAIVDSSKSTDLKKTDWDDEDSMTLVSTTTTTAKPLLAVEDDKTTPTSSEDQITEEQQRPRFISLIPAGTHDVNARSQSDQEGQDQIKYRIYPKPTTATIESEQDDGSSSATTPGSSSEEEETSRDSASSEQATTEGSRLKHVQLGKIPLTFEILLPPREEKQQLLGREDTKPIGFFPPEEMHRAKMLRREQQQQQNQQSTEEDTTEIITGKPVPDLQELPPVPLTYMVPPSRDGEREFYWNQYPQPTTTINLRNLDLPQTTTLNPFLERINDFLQKAKRHSLETETTTANNDNESSTTEDNQNTEQMETTTSAEQKESDSTEDDKENTSTTDPLTPVSDVPEDSNGDLNPSSPAPIPEEPTEEIITTRGPTILYPRPNYPQVPDYSPVTQPLLPYPPSSSPLPPPLNSINLRPSGLDQYFSDYNNFNNNPPQQQQYNPYYYPNSDPTEILRRRMMIASLLNNKPTTTTTLPPPPTRPVYIPTDSYWPRKYFNREGGFRNNGGYNNNNAFTPNYNNNNNNYNNYNNNPFTRQRPPPSGYNTNNYGYYLRPQRESPFAFPTTSTSVPIGVSLNSIIPSSSEEPSYPSYGTYGTGGADFNDLSSLGNPYYSSQYPSATMQAPSPYVMNYRPMIPYQSSNPITSSDLVNELMYAPLYPYERFRRMQAQEPGYY